MKLIRSKWWKRVIFAAIIMFIIVFLVILSINFYIRQAVHARILSSEEAMQLKEVDCILVLGCGVKDNKPSPMLEDRLEKAISLYQLQASGKLLMSGDHGRKEYDEVNVMKQYAMRAGIPSENVFMDHAGFSTYESIYRARDIFCAKRVIIVTQDYHLLRALYVANALGLNAYGVAADSNAYAGQAMRDCRELLARSKDFCYVLFSPKPGALGETIPVSGDGNITNN